MYLTLTKKNVTHNVEGILKQNYLSLVSLFCYRRLTKKRQSLFFVRQIKKDKVFFYLLWDRLKKRRKAKNKKKKTAFKK